MDFCPVLTLSDRACPRQKDVWPGMRKEKSRHEMSTDISTIDTDWAQSWDYVSLYFTRISLIFISEIETDATQSRSSSPIFDSFGWKESVEDAKQQGIFKSKIVGYPELL